MRSFVWNGLTRGLNRLLGTPRDRVRMPAQKRDGDLKDYLVDQYKKQTEQELNPMTLYLGNCELKVFNTSLEEFQSDLKYDLIFYDAFSRHSQQEMWEGETIAKVVSLMAPGGVFVTYSVTGNLKRAMRDLGLEVERMAGAPGKREMLRAIKPKI